MRSYDYRRTVLLKSRLLFLISAFITNSFRAFGSLSSCSGIMVLIVSEEGTIHVLVRGRNTQEP